MASFSSVEDVARRFKDPHLDLLANENRLFLSDGYLFREGKQSTVDRWVFLFSDILVFARPSKWENESGQVVGNLGKKATALLTTTRTKKNLLVDAASGKGKAEHHLPTQMLRPVADATFKMKQVVHLSELVLDERVSELDKFSDYPSDNCFLMVTPLRTFKVGTPSAKSTAKWLELLSMSVASEYMRSTQKRQAELEKKREKALTNPEEETKANDTNPFSADVSSPFEGASPPDGREALTKQASSRQVTEEDLFPPGWQHMFHLGTIYSACTLADIQTLETILKVNKSLANKIDNFGWSPLHYAVFKGSRKICRMLLEAISTDVEIRDKNVHHETPLYHACLKPSLPCLVALIEAGADPNQSNDQQESLLHQAATRNDIEVMLALLTNGSLITARDLIGQTPLHAAAQAGSIDALRLLLQFGVSANLHDHAGRSPVHLAANDAILRLLVQHGGHIPCPPDQKKPPPNPELEAARAEFQKMPAARTGAKALRDKGDWTDDAQSPSCLLCHSKFTTRHRRHHCRRCGVLCCNNCSLKRVHYSNSTKSSGDRTCDPCFLRMHYLPGIQSQQSRLFQDLEDPEDPAYPLAEEHAHSSILEKIAKNSGVSSSRVSCSPDSDDDDDDDSDFDDKKDGRNMSSAPTIGKAAASPAAPSKLSRAQSELKTDKGTSRKKLKGLFRRSTDVKKGKSSKSKKTSAKTEPRAKRGGGAGAAAGEARDQALKNVETARRIDDKSAAMSERAAKFNELARQIAEKEANRKWYQL